jgi:TMEM175 potassium channel family protein
MSQESGDGASHHYDTGRIEAFSDGVFAIAITLLIIEIGVPHVEGNQSLAAELWELWPSYFGFMLSFITIGVMWTNHHGIFKDIERTDHTLITLNLLLLLCISFVPFPTAVLAEYLKNDDNALAATLAYGTTFAFTAVMFNAVWIYASWHRRLIDEHVSDARIRSRTRRYLGGPLCYAIGLPVAFVNPLLAIGLWTALALFFLLPLNE